MSIEARLKALGLELPPPHKYASANRTGCVQLGNALYVGGHMPAKIDGVRVTGKVTGDMTEEDAYIAARAAGLNMLASIKQHLGGFDRIRRVIKVVGMVNSSPSFQRQWAVIDGCSDLFVALWGPEMGQHARSTFGIFESSGNIAVEVEGIFELQ